MIKRFVTTSLALCVIVGVTHAIEMPDEMSDQLFRMRVKFITQFIDRFNGKELHPMIDASDSNAEMYNFGQLIDHEFFKEDPDQRKQLALSFVDSAMTYCTKISLNDNEWFAKVGCVGDQNGKKVDWSLYLTNERYDNGVSRWVISQSDGGIFDFKPDNAESLPVNADDNGFIPLSIILDNHPRNVVNMLADSIDRVSAFATMIHCGALKMNYVDTVEFVFCQVPGFIFNVSMTEHKNTNSGWLITDIQRVSDKEKKEYLNHVYNGRTPEVKPAQETEINTNIPDDETAIGIIDRFISSLNMLIKDRSSDNYKLALSSVEGRYSFRTAGYVADKIAAKSERELFDGRYNFDEFASGLGNSPFKQIKFYDGYVVPADRVNAQYRNRFVIVAGIIEVANSTETYAEKVCVFIYGNQVAAILPMGEAVIG